MAVDYEFTMKLLRQDITRLQELQQLARERQDTTDKAIEHTSVAIGSLREIMTELATRQLELTATVQMLVDGWRSQNGHTKGEPQ